MNILLILISVLLNCAAQLCIRKGMLIVGEVGMSGMVQNLGAMISNLWLWGAMVCYAVSILMWMAVLSKVEVSFAYPFLSIGYVVAALVGYYFFDESLTFTRIAGIMVICVGVYLIRLIFVISNNCLLYPFLRMTLLSILLLINTIPRCPVIEETTSLA